MKSYNLVFLETAKRDMTEIVRYISRNLSNPSVAEKLAGKMVEVAEQLKGLPYKNRVYNPIKPLKQEYRGQVVDNYIMFYYIDENEKLIIVSRVVYGKRNYEKFLM